MKENELIIEGFMSKFADFSADAVSKIKLFFNGLFMDFADMIPGTEKDGGKKRYITVAQDALEELNGQVSSQEYAVLEDVILNNIIPRIKSGDIKKGKQFLRELLDGINVGLGK